ncbi:MAG: flap endonuclease [Agarilytica sp.]
MALGSKTKTTAKTEAGKHLYVIDASIFIFRYYFSMPSNWFASNGRPTETVYGYATWLLKFLTNEKACNVVACFDESLMTCFRNEIYPDYKMSRALPDDDLAFQLLACKQLTQLLGVSSYASDTYEADDLAGSFAKYCGKKNIPYTLLTRDKDLSQLLAFGESCMWDYPDKTPIQHDDVTSLLGVKAEQVADYLAIVGDASDDIPGVPGVGPKTAIALLSAFGSWEKIKKHNNEISALPIRGAKTLQEKMIEYEAQVDMALRLSTIATDGLKVTWRETKVQALELAALKDFCEALGFPASFMKKAGQLCES